MRDKRQVWPLVRLVAGDQRGNAMVLFTLSLTVFLAFASVAVDVGRVYVSQQQLRVIADGASLAGARALPDADAATAAAQHILDVNNVSNLGITSTITVAANKTSVTVALSRTVPTLFAQVLGISQMTVPTQAAARSGPISTVTGIVPLGVPMQTFTYGQQVTLMGSASGLGPGNYGALSLSGNGASDYTSDLKFGYQYPVHIGDYLTPKPGKMTGPTQTGVQYRIDQAPGETWTNYRVGSPRLIFVPVIDFTGAHGRSTDVPVVGFAAFFLEGANSNGDVTGRFLRVVSEGDIAADGTADFGLRATKLSQ